MTTTLFADDPPAPSSHLVGVRGWLAVLVIGLVVFRPIYALSQLDTLRLADAFVVLLVGVHTAWSTYAGLALWSRWANAPSVARWYLAGTVLILSILLAVTGEDELGDTVESAGLPYLAGWAYLAKSKRVRETYRIPLEPPRLSRWRAGLISFAMGSFLFIVGSTPSSSTPNPYRLVRSAIVKDPSGFDANFVAAFRNQSTNNDTLITSARVGMFRDDGRVLSFAITFGGHRNTNQVNVPITGESRHYIHAGGAVAVNAVCSSAAPDCARVGLLLDAVSENVVGHLRDSGFDGLVPRGGACVNQSKKAVSCSYQPDIVLQFFRWDVADAIRSYEPYLRPASK